MFDRVFTWIDPILWGEKASGRDPLALTLRLLRFPYALLRDLSRGQINLRAMGLVFTTLLALVPLLAFSFAILKAFGAHTELEPIVYEFFRPVGSAAAELTDRVMQFVDGVSSTLVGSVGFALLLWTLLGTIRKVEDSFNFLWRVEQPRSFARRIAEYLGLVIVGPLMLVAFLGLGHAALDSAPVQRMSDAPLTHGAFVQLLRLGPYVMVTAVFTGLYLFIPNTSVRLRAAAVGGLCAGMLWAAVGQLFTALVVLSSRLTLVYAGFAVIVAALLWTYFGWLILLVGARLAYYVQNPRDLRLGLADLRLSNVERERLALETLTLVAEAHVRGDEGWSVDALAQRLGVPGLAIAQIVASLERARLVIATEQDRLMPARDIGGIEVADVLDVIRRERSGHVALPHATLESVARLARELDAARRERCAGRTLRDLLEPPSTQAGPPDQAPAIVSSSSRIEPV